MLLRSVSIIVIQWRNVVSGALGEKFVEAPCMIAKSTSQVPLPRNAGAHVCRKSLNIACLKCHILACAGQLHGILTFQKRHYMFSSLRSLTDNSFLPRSLNKGLFCNRVSLATVVRIEFQCKVRSKCIHDPMFRHVRQCLQG